jgi:peptide/nickel transport system substrate-binding protein
MPRSFRLIALWVSAAILLSSACHRATPAKEAPARLRIAAAVPLARAADLGLAALVNGLAKDALFAYGVDGRPLASLAESWSWNDSRTRLRVRLRDGVLFHDGEHLTADLAVNSLRESLTTERVVSFGGVKSIAPIDRSTLDITLEQPDSFLLADLASVSIQLRSNPNIGTGPFRIGESSNSGAKLYAFNQYYRGRPALDGVEIQAYETQRKAWAAMLRGDADVLHDVSRDAADFIEAETRVKTYTFPRAYYIALVFNQRNAALQSPAVRRAINRAINRDQIVTEALRGRGKSADGPVWPDHWAYSPPRHPFTYDPENARKELDAAHLPVDRDAAGGMPRRFSFKCLVYAQDSRFDRTALLVQKNLYDVGVDMRLEPVTYRELVGRTNTGDFDAFLFEMVSGKDLGWVYAFWHSPQADRRLIDTGYRSADAVLDDMRHATSDEGVRSAVAALGDVLTTDPPAAFLAWQAQSRAASKRVVIPEEPNRDILLTARLWRLANTDEARR